MLNKDQAFKGTCAMAPIDSFKSPIGSKKLQFGGALLKIPLF